MWQKKISVVRANIRFSAFSLFEVLVATALGAFLLLLSASSYTDFYYHQVRQKELFHLQADAHQLLHYFNQHFQQLGYQGDKRSDHNFDLFQLNGKSVNIPYSSCLIAFYDLNQDGCLGKRKTKTAVCKLGEINNTKDLLKEIFGFKVENKEIYTFSHNFDNCTKTECQKLLESCNGNWSKFTDVNNMKVNQLTFSWKKENSLLEIILELESAKYADIKYFTKSYIFILNN